RRDVLTPRGEKGLPYASRLLGLCVVMAILSAFALARCYLSRSIDQAKASDVNNRNFAFTCGGVFASALKNVSTTLAFSNNAQNFTLISTGAVSGTASGTSSVVVGSCSLTVTNSTYNVQINSLITLNPCTYNSSDNTLTVSNGT